VSGLLSPPAADAGALGDGDGLTTHLLLDEQALGAWGPPGARSSLGGGRGSVGSNVLTMHQVRPAAAGGACTCAYNITGVSMRRVRDHVDNLLLQPTCHICHCRLC
jgi:hypothetical protein